MTTAQKAIDLLRNQMTGDDLRKLSDVDLSALESICHHWLHMAAYERTKRIKPQLGIEGAPPRSITSFADRK